jgi:hypothetical protein
MKKADSVLPLVEEWPLGPPHYPVKKVICAVCGRAVWLEQTPEYYAVREHVRFVCTDCFERSIKK